MHMTILIIFECQVFENLQIISLSTPYKYCQYIPKILDNVLAQLIKVTKVTTYQNSIDVVSTLLHLSSEATDHSLEAN